MSDSKAYCLPRDSLRIIFIWMYFTAEKEKGKLFSEDYSCLKISQFDHLYCQKYQIRTTIFILGLSQLLETSIGDSNYGKSWKWLGLKIPWKGRHFKNVKPFFFQKRTGKNCPFLLAAVKRRNLTTHAVRKPVHSCNWQAIKSFRAPAAEAKAISCQPSLFKGSSLLFCRLDEVFIKTKEIDVKGRGTDFAFHSQDLEYVDIRRDEGPKEETKESAGGSRWLIDLEKKKKVEYF